MMFRGKVAAVSYLNTIPFIYGIEHARLMHAHLLLSPPSRCAESFRSGETEIALIPTGSLPFIGDHMIVTPYCIGAHNPVRTVTIMSDCEGGEIETLYLDGHSRTSAILARIICTEIWGIDPEYIPLDDYTMIGKRRKTDGFLLIGDKVFDYESRFQNIYDLASLWQDYTNLPFVFAVWIAKSDIDPRHIDSLSKSLDFGINHIKEAVDYYGHSGKLYAEDYLTNNIDYIFDLQKRQALSLFWEKGQKFTPNLNPG